MAVSLDADPALWYALFWLGLGALLASGITQWLGTRVWRRETDRLGEALEQATELANVGILRIDAGRRTVHANRAVTRLSGLSEVELLAGGWGRGIFPDDQNATIAELRSAFGQELPVDITYRYLRPDGKVLHIRHLASSIRDRGRFAGYLGVLLDVSEETKRAEESNEVRRLAEEVNQRRFEFLSHAGHEIRTPLGGVIGMVNLLLRTELEPSQRDLAKAASTAANRLLLTLDDLLDFSRIESGRLELDLLEFDLRGSIEETIDQVRQRATEKGLDITLLLPANLPDRVVGDPARLRQVLRHLVKHAIDSTMRGEVVVAVERMDQDYEQARFRFDVTDHGPSLCDEEQREALDSLLPSGVLPDGREWCGLDLTLSKQLAELLGGEVGFAAHPGLGNTRWFTLPLAIRQASPDVALLRQCDLHGLRALVVDDHPVNRQLVHRLTEGWGMESISAAGGEEALELLRQERLAGRSIHVALLDMQMPGMNGMELARRIKGSAGWSRLPLVMLSSMVSRGQAHEAHQSGFSAYLTKPLRADHLRETIAAVTSEDVSPAVLVTRHVLSEAERRSRPRALVAVLEPSQRNRLVRNLEAKRFRVDVVSDTFAAADAIVRVGYKLAFIDVLGPRLDALALAERIRSAEGGDRHTPLIALAADRDPLHRSAAFASGLDDVLSRSMDPTALDAVIRRWVPELEEPESEAPPLREAA